MMMTLSEDDLERSGLYSSRQTASEIIDSADDKLFDQVIQRNHHVLHQLLTDRVDISYNLRLRAHCRVLPEKKGRLYSWQKLHR